MKMTDSENSQHQDDSDEDIYKDIPEFNFEDELAKLEGSKETYKQEVSDLSEKVKILTEENKELKKSNEVLKKNLSTLLKTAQAEVQRKDSLIEELRSKVESFTFRRTKQLMKDKFTSTNDLIQSFEAKQETKKPKSESENKRSKSSENRTSSESERRFKQEEEQKSRSRSWKEENSNRDHNKKSGRHRENAQNTNFKNSESSRDTHRDKHKERKSAKYEDSSSHRRPFRESHREHLLYDTFDKKRHSRSSDNRFLSRRRSSRERGREQRRSDSCERGKEDHGRGKSSERSRRQGSKTERSRSRGSKESSIEKPKVRSSTDNEIGERVKDGMGVRGSANGVESKKRVENWEKKRSEEKSAVGKERSKDKKEKSHGKGDKRRSGEAFEIKSPLDALYMDMIASSNRYSNSKPGTANPESHLEEGEIATVKDVKGGGEEKEDWTLSFKNERQNEAKPMTLYSRRMMQKFSSEEAKKSKLEKGAKERKRERENAEKLNEKEPGELTDDENVIESSKEFQELAKVAAIESEIIEKPDAEVFKEPKLIEPVGDIEGEKTETLSKDVQKELEQPNAKEESNACKEVESTKADVIEFSPFKNNYKLIEISPIKPPGKEHVLDFYKKAPSTEGNAPDASEKVEAEKDAAGKPSDTSEEKDIWKNSSSENNSDAELKIVTPSLRGSSRESEKTVEIKENEPEEKKEVTKKRENNCKQETDSTARKRKSSSKMETEEVVSDERTRKRRRQPSETEEKKPKQAKMSKSEPSRKSTRSKRNSKNEGEGSKAQEMEVKSVGGQEINMKEDISSFEFFKPIVAAEHPEAPAKHVKTESTKTDFKMTATMSLTEVHLETPNKCVGKLKNLTINEQMIFNPSVLDPKNHPQFSPLIGSKSIEMTPRRMLKNDLMLTDSEDDSICKQNAGGEDVEEGDVSKSEYSDCDSDSGASDFVDLL